MVFTFGTLLRGTDYGMSDNGTDRESVNDDKIENDDLQQDSGSEYQSEENSSDDEVRSTRSGRSERSDRSQKSESGKKTIARKPVLPHVTKSTKATYSEAYRDIYNEHVEELARPFQSVTHALPPSEIGVAMWTPLEKEILFQRISVLGKDNIKAISDALRTKSEPEVRQYLSLLDQGTAEGNVTKALPVFSAADVPGAFEVSKQSEAVLEEYADGLAKYQTKSDAKREKKRHGDYWLLTQELAQEVEAQVRSHDGSYVMSKLDHEEQDEEVVDDARAEEDALIEASEEAKTDDLDPKTGPEADEDTLETTAPHQEFNEQSSEPADELMVPAAELLDLPMWLRLSQLFMHQSPDLGNSWTDFITSREETPSMYQTSFQDFHNVTVSLTRRLVQTTIFQTMTRLRARDKDQPSAAVTTSDVRTAVEVLDLQPNMRKFWGSVPRRHGLRVYERGSKFTKGQSRAGVELSLEEAEERLGVGHTSSVNTQASDNVMNTVEDEAEEDVLGPDQYYEDPELWTEASDNEDERPITISDDHLSDASDDGDAAAYQPTDDEEAQDAAKKKRLRKGRLEQNYRKAHDAYLEAVDQEISRAQEVEIWDTLGVPPPSEVKDEEVEIPRQPVIRRRLSDAEDWRDGLEYQPLWERGFNAVQPETFANMQNRGEQARKRRRLAYDYLEQEGLVTLPQQTPEVTVIRRKIKPTDVDIKMDDAPTEEPLAAPIQSFDDGVPRRKHTHPNPILSRVQSRASSVRAGSHDTSISESSNPKNFNLANRLTTRKQSQQIEEGLKKAQEEREAEVRLAEEKRQAEEEQRKARMAFKALSEEEKRAVMQQRKEEKNRKMREKKKMEKLKQERQEERESKRLAKEEKQRAKQEKPKKSKEPEIEGRKRKATEPDVAGETEAQDDTLGQEKPKEQETSTQDQKLDQGTGAGPMVEAAPEAARITRSRSKKPRRKSGF
ncbi:hypothetical protein E4T38_02958 [Aureobasidium subglaciale]|nr:hypothetical protein E4T38_02958 [Aureobasidium subglaciale]KAI5227253.1 hypothetical protein E4T40_02605 [Aureobasidium subglaciale]KAI5230582.1 hypothetical protein E4T41_02957 [Aureobasidium subglaciale]KAI5264932.1 hypothetical protein E4T46_02735 [Aureobasidium subglaciale]